MGTEGYGFLYHCRHGGGRLCRFVDGEVERPSVTEKRYELPKGVKCRRLPPFDQLFPL